MTLTSHEYLVTNGLPIAILKVVKRISRDFLWNASFSLRGEYYLWQRRNRCHYASKCS